MKATVKRYCYYVAVVDGQEYLIEKSDADKISVGCQVDGDIINKKINDAIECSHFDFTLDASQVFSVTGKTMASDFDMLIGKIRRGECFSLSRWGDGELCILEGKDINLLNKGCGEFSYDHEKPQHQLKRDEMVTAFKHQGDGYYIGVVCSCCAGLDKRNYMIKESGQPLDRLVFANVFVNVNYPKTKSKFFPLLNGQVVNVVVNSKSDIKGLPFNVNKCWYVGTDAWINDDVVLEEFKDYCRCHDGEVYLFAAGPFSNILCYNGWSLNKNNTYIDVGSILDPFLGLPVTRGYLKGGKKLQSDCVW